MSKLFTKNQSKTQFGAVMQLAYAESEVGLRLPDGTSERILLKTACPTESVVNEPSVEDNGDIHMSLEILKWENSWKNRAGDLGVSHCGWGWAGKFLDADNSGNISIFSTNGFVSAGKKEYWYDLGIMATTPGLMVADAANWPEMGDMSLSGYEQKCLFLNRGGGSFQEVAQEVGITSTYDGRGVAVVDLFNRGTLDLILANQNAPLQVYRSTNETGNHWLTLTLVGRPASNRDAVGARVTLITGGRKLVVERDGGHGFASQSDGRIHLGLGQETRAERIEIRWPSGRTQVLTNVEADQFLTVLEPDTPVAGARE